MDSEVIALCTLQFSWGGLFDARPADGLVHLVRETRSGTPGPTLCGIDRFAKGAPGWSVGGWISGPGITLTPCEGCVSAARADFPELSVSGLGAEGVALRLCEVKTLPSEQQLTIDLGMEYTGAAISGCGRYRYELTRRWGDGPLLEFIMLNPSTADESKDDPTIRRCIGFAKRWGYGGIVVRNLYAWRATNPAELANVDDPVGPENRDYLSRQDADCTIAAWGAHPAAVGWWNGYPFGWQRTVIERHRLLCLGVNANGSPKHPLYVPSSRTPIPWEVSTDGR